MVTLAQTEPGERLISCQQKHEVIETVLVKGSRTRIVTINAERAYEDMLSNCVVIEGHN